ncbi:MAG: ATP-binding protein [Deinococcales bacterium]
MQLTIAADTSQLERLGNFIKDACAGFARPLLIELAVAEIVTNTINYGKAHSCTIHVEKKRHHHYEDFEITIEDDGIAFNPLKQASQPLGELREGGYGLAIVKQAAKSLRYERLGSINRLYLTFGEKHHDTEVSL